MPFQFNIPVGKVIAIRIRKLFRRRRVDNEEDKSLAQKTNIILQQALPFASAVAPAIPVAGTPLQAAINALLILLKGITTRTQNQDDAARLINRLNSLWAIVSTAQAVGNGQPLLQAQLEIPLKDLEAILKKVQGLPVKSLLVDDIAQAILACEKQIDKLQMDYIFSSHIQQQSISRIVHQNIVCVVDATGHQFNILFDQCATQEQFMAVLGSYFLDDSRKHKALRHFISQGKYDFCIEADTGTIQLNEWSQVQAGQKIIMRVVFEQIVDNKRNEYQCPRPTCKTWNNKKVSKNGWIDCAGCPGRFEILNANHRYKETQLSKQSTISTVDDFQDLDVLQNFHIINTINERADLEHLLKTKRADEAMDRLAKHAGLEERLAELLLPHHSSLHAKLLGPPDQ